MSVWTSFVLPLLNLPDACLIFLATSFSSPLCTSTAAELSTAFEMTIFVILPSLPRVTAVADVPFAAALAPTVSNSSAAEASVEGFVDRRVVARLLVVLRRDRGAGTGVPLALPASAETSARTPPSRNVSIGSAS